MLLPQEIFDEILTHLPHSRRGRKALSSCSLVCHSFRHGAQRHLFRRIALYDVKSEPTILDQIVEGAPHLVRYIEELYINGDLSFSGTGLFAKQSRSPQSLEIFCRGRNFHGNLREITLDTVSWPGLSPAMQVVLQKLLSGESLRFLVLENVEGFPALSTQDLFATRLKSLRMNDAYLPSYPLEQAVCKHGNLTELQKLTIKFSAPGCRLQHYLRNLTGQVTSVAQLQTLEVSSCNQYSWPTYRHMIQRISESPNSLQRLSMQIHISEESFTPIDLRHFSRLSKITISTHLFPSPKNLSSFQAALTWLAWSLKTLSYDNAIKCLKISFLPSMDPAFGGASLAGATLDEDVWRRLDAALSQPQLTSSETFRGITFDFYVTSNYVYDHWRALTYSQLPRIKKSKRLRVRKKKCTWLSDA